MSWAPPAAGADRLPAESVLAEQFGVSRMGVREALRVLELQGLVEVRHGYAGGVFVAEPNGAALLGALEDSLRQGQVGADELYQARVLVEPAIARLAAEQDPDALGRATGGQRGPHRAGPGRAFAR